MFVCFEHIETLNSSQTHTCRLFVKHSLADKYGDKYSHMTQAFLKRPLLSVVISYLYGGFPARPHPAPRRAAQTPIQISDAQQATCQPCSVTLPLLSALFSLKRVFVLRETRTGGFCLLLFTIRAPAHRFLLFNQHLHSSSHLAGGSTSPSVGLTHSDVSCSTAEARLFSYHRSHFLFSKPTPHQ